MRCFGLGVLLIVGLPLLSSCSTHRLHRHGCGCISYQDQRRLDRLLDDAAFEAKYKKSDGLTRTMMRLTREKPKRPPHKCPKKIKPKKKVKLKKKYKKKKTRRYFRKTK